MGLGGDGQRLEATAPAFTSMNNTEVHEREPRDGWGEKNIHNKIQGKGRGSAMEVVGLLLTQESQLLLGEP